MRERSTAAPLTAPVRASLARIESAIASTAQMSESRRPSKSIRRIPRGSPASAGGGFHLPVQQKPAVKAAPAPREFQATTECAIRLRSALGLGIRADQVEETRQPDRGCPKAQG
jgi:hypothetical protein